GGAIFYELRTARPPFQGATVLEILEQVRSRTADSPSLSNPAVDRDLATICLHCLEKSPGRRYPSAAALADDLRRWLNHEPIRARPVGPGARPGRWWHLPPVLAPLAASVAVLAGAPASVATTKGGGRGMAPARGSPAGRRANGRLCQSFGGQAGLGRATGRMGQRFAGLEALENATAIARTLGLATVRFREL